MVTGRVRVEARPRNYITDKVRGLPILTTTPYAFHLLVDQLPMVVMATLIVGRDVSNIHPSTGTQVRVRFKVKVGALQQIH